MWYFAWILGVTAALAIAVINVMWYEFQNAFEADGIELDVVHRDAQRDH